jgi:hypothetical protein
MRLDREEAAALEIAGDDLGDAAGHLDVRGAACVKIGQRDRYRLHIAFVDVDAKHRLRRAAGQRGGPEAGTVSS